MVWGYMDVQNIGGECTSLVSSGASHVYIRIQNRRGSLSLSLSFGKKEREG